MHYLGRASLEAEQKYRVPCSRPTNATTREVGEHATRYRIESHSKYKWRTYGQWKKQLALEVGEDGQTLLTMDVYDAGQNRIAQLRRNAWLLNDSDRFNITTNPKSLKLIDTATEETVVEVNTLLGRKCAFRMAISIRVPVIQSRSRLATCESEV